MCVCACVQKYVCVCVCVCVRERERIKNAYFAVINIVYKYNGGEKSD